VDTLTHGFAGVLLARALPGTGDVATDRAFARREAWLGFAAAMFPDADALASPFSPEFYITQHRALTHSFVLLPVWALLLAWAASFRPPEAAGPPGSPERRVFRARLAAVSGVAVLSHILMDWITSWGTMFFSPFDWSRYTLDWVFILDAVLTGLLLVGLGGVWLAARRGFSRSRTAARAALAAATAYVFFCGLRHAEADRLLARLAPGAALRAAIPQLGSPDRWLLLADDGAAVSASFVDLAKSGAEGARASGSEDLVRSGYAGGLKAIWTHLPGVYRSRDDLLTRVIPKANGPLAARTLGAGVNGVFGRFARFPAAREEAQADGGVRVVLRDVRFGYLSPDLDPFTYVVRYDAGGRLLAADFPSGRWMRREAATGVGATPMRIR
jgi:inner membrane protein